MSETEAAKALQRFTDGFNKANRTLDAKANASYESGALLSIDEAGIKAAHAVRPQGNPTFPALTLKDAHFTVPTQAGWPKSFLADAVSNRKDRGGNYTRWFVVFSRDAVDAPWRAVYLSTLPGNKVPELARDADGYAEAVPAGDGASGLTVDPGKLSRSYANYLKTGEGDLFASGPSTDLRRRDRAAKSHALGARIQWEDQPADFPPVALRTKDGGALVFFAAYYHQQKTVFEGSPMSVSLAVQGVMAKPVKQASKITLTYLTGQAVKVPAKGSSGKVEVLNLIEARTSARVP
ncbi:hypothetical protein [Streptomyces pinistramenti]|uniref:hypothetical protein n=1 Tax=Streptomyces pinistramenti TaxID=2884812 RepID=UPI001D07FA8C|nr:hypothetical protein [Streptomyces pinistramenti]MCB5907142.1 hypothetical protein [Streptomyces pinistramenti]